MDTLENARKRSEYWKANNAAATKEIEALRTILRQVLVDAQAQDVLAEWWPVMERAIDGGNHV